MAVSLNEGALLLYIMNIFTWTLTSILILKYATKTHNHLNNTRNRIFGYFGMYFGVIRLIFHLIPLFFPNDLIVTILVYMFSILGFLYLLNKLENEFFGVKLLIIILNLTSTIFFALIIVSLHFFLFKLALITYYCQNILFIIIFLSLSIRLTKSNPSSLKSKFREILTSVGILIVLFGSFASTELVAFDKSLEILAPLIILLGFFTSYFYSITDIFRYNSSIIGINIVKIRRIQIKRFIQSVLFIVVIIGFHQVYIWLYFLGKEPTKIEIKEPKVHRTLDLMDRGLIALYDVSGKAYISWRLLNSDPPNTFFNVYRKNSGDSPVKLNSEPIFQTTDYIDTSLGSETNYTYFVRAIINNEEVKASKEVPFLNNNHLHQNYFSIPLKEKVKVKDVAIADLNGDGAYDFIIKYPNDNIDPFSHRPSQDTYKIEAYLSNGSFLWKKDLGWDIELGTWYSPFIAYDLDLNGKAEIAIKTGEGDHRDRTGHVQSGSEYISIWDGMSGEEIIRAPWPKRTFNPYNWISRNQIGVAYLDGINPFLLLERGTYTNLILHSYNYSNGSLDKIWEWESTQEGGILGINQYFGQGAHSIHSADVDKDNCDEVVLGSCVIDENGEGLWSTGLYHCDHCYVGDIIPDRSGLEIYYGIEGELGIGEIPHPTNGICMVDASNGEIIWGINYTTTHIHKSGLVSDIDATHSGMEVYSGEANFPNRWLHSSNGTLLATESSFDLGLSPRAVYWDEDLQRELLYDGRIFNLKRNNTHLKIPGNGILWGDFLGDWREEFIICVEGELRVYTTTIPAIDRRFCLMQDPIYRLDVAHVSMGYKQVPTTSYCLSY